MPLRSTLFQRMWLGSSVWWHFHVRTLGELFIYLSSYPAQTSQTGAGTIKDISASLVTELGGAMQLMGILRLLLDPENMLATANVSSHRNLWQTDTALPLRWIILLVRLKLACSQILILFQVISVVVIPKVYRPWLLRNYFWCCALLMIFFISMTYVFSPLYHLHGRALQMQKWGPLCWEPRAVWSRSK